MAERKYFYLKLKENFFESDAMLLLESEPDGYLFSNILLKLYLKSLKDEGRLVLNGRIPYNAEMIARVTRHSVETVEKAIEAFKSFGLIEILDTGVIYMTDIQNFIGTSTSEADRKREYRERINAEKASGQMSGQTSDKCPTEKELKKESKKETDKTAQARRGAVNLNDLLPEYDFSQTVADALRSWVTYKAERREGYKAQGMKSLLSQVQKHIAEHGEQAVCDLIEESMAAGWKGIAWARLEKSGKPQERGGGMYAGIGGGVQV